MYAVPREQLVRPGQRRSLMRRALVGIVPDELLNRKRKAYITRGPLADISADWTRYVDLTQHMVSTSLGIVDTGLFYQSLARARSGQPVELVPVLRAISIEMWLRSLGALNQRHLDGAQTIDFTLCMST